MTYCSHNTIEPVIFMVRTVGEASMQVMKYLFGILKYVMKIESTVTQYRHANTTTLVHVCVYITHH